MISELSIQAKEKYWSSPEIEIVFSIVLSCIILLRLIASLTKNCVWLNKIASKFPLVKDFAILNRSENFWTPVYCSLLEANFVELTSSVCLTVDIKSHSSCCRLEEFWKCQCCVEFPNNQSNNEVTFSIPASWWSSWWNFLI